MDKKYPLSHFLDLIQQPIAICDGGQPQSDVEWKINDFLEKQLKVPFDHNVNLYDLPELYDLSKYKTISFATQEYYISEKIKTIFDFDKSNLKCLIVQNRNSFHLVEDQAKELGIVVVGFDREWAGFIGLLLPQEEYDHPFFDPFAEGLSHMWH
jgi:hypothetical protein